MNRSKAEADRVSGSYYNFKYRGQRRGFTGKETLEQRPLRGEGVILGKTRERAFQARGL